MEAEGSAEITGLLKAWGVGDASALDRLTELVHRELRNMARRYMKDERARVTLQATALVNEVYIRLVDVKNIGWENRAQFFALSAQLMRRILVEFARSRRRQKRGGGIGPTSLDEALIVSPEPSADLLALDDALKDLAAIDPRQSQVVELRFFGGLSVEETAEVLKVSPETVMRDWKLSKAWLLRAMQGGEPHEAGTVAAR